MIKILNTPYLINFETKVGFLVIRKDNSYLRISGNFRVVCSLPGLVGKKSIILRTAAGKS